MKLKSILLEKRPKITIIIVIIFVVGLVILFQHHSIKKYESKIEALKTEVEQLSDPVAVYEVASKEVDLRLIHAKIQEIGELASIEYLYTDAGKFEDPARIFGKDIPFSFTTKSFIAKWDGSIKAGIDINKVTEEKDALLKKIIIHIPKAEILSHEIMEDSIETLDEKNGLFNKIKVEDVREFDAISKDAMEERVIENGLLDKAFENAKVIISRLLNTEITEESDYSIVFETIED